jgi:hypothetical protein
VQQVSTIMAFMASFNCVLTKRTAENLGVLARGAILAHGPRTATNCILSAWLWADCHWSAYANVLRRARMDLRKMGRILFKAILGLIPLDDIIELAVDESLVRRYGPRVVGVGIHRDAVRSSKSRPITTPGHKWVIVSVIVHLAFVNRALALPVASALYTTKKRAKRNHAESAYRKHRTVGELTLLLVRMVMRWAPDRKFRILGDGAYGTHELADAMNPKSKRYGFRRGTLVSRFHMDASTYAPPPAYGGHGRPRLIGRRMPTPAAVAANPKTVWQRKVVEWYGGERRAVLLCSETGLWYKCGCSATSVRWVVVRDPEGKYKDEVFFTTDLTLTPAQIVEAFVRRWSLETTFQEARGLLGLETLRNRCGTAVRRSVPMLLGLYSVIVVWFARHVRNPQRFRCHRPWYIKTSVTFSDMLAAARQDAQRDALSLSSGAKTGEFFLPAMLDLPLDASIRPIRRRA